MSEKAPRYSKEYWTGDSRNGQLLNADGYHYFKMSELAIIEAAFEVYEQDDGDVVVTPLPEMLGVSWLEDLGYEDYDSLEKIDLEEFEYVEELYQGLRKKS
ncbi:MAG: hypothetical protein KBD78_05775 [Oligoflexales bacterium]|jgi:hypothetical protein|nr:hypothetical protein [Oligoflexales bacterium]